MGLERETTRSTKPKGEDPRRLVVVQYAGVPEGTIA